MPYVANAELPASVRDQLPALAQDIYRSAFNSAYENSADDPVEEAAAHIIAWEAVKRSYVEEGGEWVRRGVLG